MHANEMEVLGEAVQFCDCCKRRTPHLKVLINGVILFLCAEKHGNDVLKDIGKTARERLHAHDAGCFPKEAT